MKIKSFGFVWTVAMLLGGSAWCQNPISPALLEANLGPLAVDAYDGITANSAAAYPVAHGPQPSCAGTYRACIQAVLGGYGGYNCQGVTGNTWTGSFYGGTTDGVPPRIAALGNGSEAIVVLDTGGVVWRTTFTEGTGNGWQPWVQASAVLADVAPAAAGGQLYLAGRTQGGDLYWWSQGTNQWTDLGHTGFDASALSATPRSRAGTAWKGGSCLKG